MQAPSSSSSTSHVLSAGREVRVSYEATAKQTAAHSCPADILLYGGAAGGGKSRYLLMEAFVRALEVPGSVAMLMRRTFPELEGSLIMESRKLFPPEVARYNEAKHVWTIKTGSADSFIFFGYCEKEKDVFKYQSAQWQFLGLDESTHFTQFQFEMLYSRVRSAIPGAFPAARLCTNPGNIGHGWHKKFFRIPTRDPKQAALAAKPGEVWQPPLEEGMTILPPTRCFIPSSIYDNPHLMEADPQYIGRLEALPPVQRKMLLYGEWDSFAGQFFTEFDKGKHVIKRFSVPRHWKVWRGIDFGYADPFACLWFAGAPDGHYFAFREAYQRDLRDKQQAEVVWMGSNWGYHDPMEIEYTVADPSMMIKSRDTGISTQEVYHSSAGIILIPASNARVHGWMALRNLLAIDPKTGTPWLQITEDCPNLIRELEEAISDTTKPEDVNTDGSDHAIDAARYWASSRPSAMIAQQQLDPQAGMDHATRKEWDAHRRRTSDANAARNQATLYGLNRED